jgi:hypothetical protein
MPNSYISRSTMKKEVEKKPLVKGKDYYIDKGLYVFTEQYLRERGYCCESGCRHCPYGFRKGGDQDDAGGASGYSIRT